jgi:hypothetical protein
VTSKIKVFQPAAAWVDVVMSLPENPERRGRQLRPSRTPSIANAWVSTAKSSDNLTYDRATSELQHTLPTIWRASAVRRALPWARLKYPTRLRVR